MSWLEILWLIEILGITISSSLAIWAPQLLQIVTDLVKYGKSSTSHRSQILRLIQIPKRYFTHFYIVGAVLSTYLLFGISLQSNNQQGPLKLLDYLRYLADYDSKRSKVSLVSIELCLTIWWLHTIRRLFESAFVSVYSHTTINLLHYILGLSHYALVPISVISMTPTIHTASDSSISMWNIGYNHVLGVALFIIASYFQHRVLQHFANMRKNHLGNVTNYAHAIPMGGLFNLVSCPHFLYEIVIYFGLMLTLGRGHSLAPYIFGFTFCNQTLAAIITHQWYIKRFGKTYPKERMAIFPYLM